MDNKLILNIRGYIGECWEGEGTTASAIIKQLEIYDGDEIEVNINSTGGSVFEGFSIYNAIKNHKATSKTCIISSTCMSIATIIMLACNKIKAEFASVVMIHRPSAFVFSGGDKTILEKQANSTINILDEIEKVAIPLYATRLKKTNEEIFEMLDKETSLNAISAFNLGIVDEVLNAPKATMFFNSFKMLFGKENLKKEILKEAHKIELSEKEQNKKGTVMKYKNLDELIAALNAFAENLTDEQKAKLAEIIEAIDFEEKEKPEETPPEENKEPEASKELMAMQKQIAQMQKDQADMQIAMKAKDESFAKMFGHFGKGSQDDKKMELKGLEKTKADYAKIYLNKGEK